jgi:hypothetical protein
VAPAYVPSEVARLLPRLAEGEPAAAESVEEWAAGWRYERLYTALAELLSGVARRAALVLLIEDVHWADAATLDFLTYFARAGRGGAVSVVVTCRSDEVPLDATVADWLTHVRRDAGVEEIRLGPLSHAEVAEQVTALTGAAPPAGLVEEVYARGEGHPFFTEQLVAAAVTDSGQLAPAVALPARLAELLLARTARCGSDGQAVLAALAVAGRPLTEGMLGEVARLNRDRIRTSVRELTAAGLLAAGTGGGRRPQHALLAEAVGADLLPDERISLHERLARALESTGDETLAAEAAGHWAAAGRSREELHARVAAARVAEQVFAYADAATHWQRAIELCQAESGAVLSDRIELPHLYIRAVDALDVSGDSVRAAVVAEEAYRRFAEHPDPTTAAVIHLRAGYLRSAGSPAAGRPLMNEALRLFEGTPPSAEHAKAWYWYAGYFLTDYEGACQKEIFAALHRAREVAEAAGAATLIAQILCELAFQSFVRGEVEDGFRLLSRARGIPEASHDAWAVLTLAVHETAALLTLGKLEEATQVGLRGMETARKLGVGNSGGAGVAANTVEGLLGRGRTAEAAALIDPQTAGPIDRDNVHLHACRGEIDLLRGEVDAAAERLNLIKLEASLDLSRELGQRVAEVAAWAGRPDEALGEVQRILGRLEDTGWVIFCGWLLAVGMRALVQTPLNGAEPAAMIRACARAWGCGRPDLLGEA